jgi:hypothetical protein
MAMLDTAASYETLRLTHSGPVKIVTQLTHCGSGARTVMDLAAHELPGPGTTETNAELMPARQPQHARLETSLMSDWVCLDQSTSERI